MSLPIKLMSASVEFLLLKVNQVPLYTEPSLLSHFMKPITVCVVCRCRLVAEAVAS